MIEEIAILGVYAPAALVWGVLAALLTWLLRPLLHRLPLARLVWHAGLAEFALFVGLWWSLAVLADLYLPVGLAHHR